MGSSYSKIMAAESLVKMYNERMCGKRSFLMSPGIFRNMQNVNPVGSYKQFSVYTFFSYAEMHFDCG